MFKKIYLYLSKFSCIQCKIFISNEKYINSILLSLRSLKKTREKKNLNSESSKTLLPYFISFTNL